VVLVASATAGVEAGSFKSSASAELVRATEVPARPAKADKAFRRFNARDKNFAEL